MKKISVFVACLMLMSVVGCSKSLKVTVKENAVLEYGEKLDHSLLFDKDNSDEGVTVKEVKSFDNKKTGEQEITVIFTNADEKTKEETLKVTVKDTKKPEIKLKKDKLEITEGDKFDAVANIESVKDPVDGDIKKSDDKKLTKNGYLIASDVDVKKAGSYTVKITAFDVNGNKAESSYKVSVKAKPQEPEVQQPVNQTPTQTNTNNGYSSNQGNSSNNSQYSTSQTDEAKRQCEQSGGTYSNNICSWTYTEPEIDMSTHVHQGNAVGGMYFDTGDELDAWVFSDDCPYTGAYGVSECPCGKLYINGFR